jgi:hypothetical protein
MISTRRPVLAVEYQDKTWMRIIHGPVGVVAIMIILMIWYHRHCCFGMMQYHPRLYEGMMWYHPGL